MSVDPRRYADLKEHEQRRVLEAIVRASPCLMGLLHAARALAAPDWRLVSGVLYQTVWNSLTGRADGHGLKDVDLAYFDASDLSWEAEDAVIQRVKALVEDAPAPVEARNQARVHLWFAGRFGAAYPPLTSTDEALERYPMRVQALGVRLEPDGTLDIAAPFGLEDLFALRLRPNPLCPTPQAFAEKARRALAVWPEAEICESARVGAACRHD